MIGLPMSPGPSRHGLLVLCVMSLALPVGTATIGGGAAANASESQGEAVGQLVQQLGGLATWCDETKLYPERFVAVIKKRLKSDVFF